ncbi:MAG: TIGR04283 family arsenosugar biosynthesis glycosyltransferase [Pseudomonadota bacterium]
MLRLSVVIPTLNAAATLPTTLAALVSGDAIEREMVVVDGGSDDGTPALAETLGATVVAASKGRGGQLAAGAAATEAPWLLFLHADTRLQAGWSGDVLAFAGDAANRDKAAVFRFALDDQVDGARRLERRVAWRTRVLGLPYGDQGLLISRALYSDIGGFRAMPLMEDVDIVRRLGRARLVTLPSAAVTSAERYRGSYFWRSARNVTCLCLYFVGVPPRWLVRLYG